MSKSVLLSAQKPQLNLRFSKLRCGICKRSAYSKWARPFRAERIGTGILMWCAQCDPARRVAVAVA